MTEEPTPDKPVMAVADVVGIKPIEEMTKDELIDEILRVNRIHFTLQEIESLQLSVLDTRIKVFRDEQLTKLKLREVPGFLGTAGFVKEGEEGEQES